MTTRDTAENWYYLLRCLAGLIFIPLLVIKLLVYLLEAWAEYRQSSHTRHRAKKQSRLLVQQAQLQEQKELLKWNDDVHRHVIMLGASVSASARQWHL